MSKVWWLHSQQVLSQLNQAEINHLFHLMPLSHYEANQVVFSCDLPNDVLFWVQSGEVSMIQKTPAKTEKELIRLSSGQMFGSMSWIDEGKKMIYGMTTSPAQMMVLRKPAFEKLMKFFPELSHKMSQQLKQVLADESKLRKNRAFPHQYRRVIRILGHYADNPDFAIAGKIADFPLSYQELAELSLVPVAIVKEIIQHLQKRNLLTLHHHYLKVCDKIRLLEET